MNLYTALDHVRFRPFAKWLYRVRIHGAEEVPPAGPCILVANHESLIDPWILGLVTPRPIRYMAKAEFFRNPVARAVMEAWGTFPVERGTGDHAAVGAAGQLLEQGEVLGIFPQGTCLPYRDRPWHRGAARLALVSGAPVVPVALIDTEKALRPHRVRLGRPHIRVYVARVVQVERQRPTIAAAKALMRRIEEAVAELRRPFGPPAHVWMD